jgi:hypothetical protein
MPIICFNTANTRFQLKEEFENDDEFLQDYMVSKQRNAGGPAAPDAQAQPT